MVLASISQIVQPCMSGAAVAEPGELSLGHNSTAVTEQVYRQQIRPVVQAGAVVVDGLFGTL